MLSVFNRPDASFEFPAVATTAEYCINFWSTTPIPDALYDQFLNSHNTAIDGSAHRRSVAKFDAWLEEFGDNPPNDTEQGEEWERIADDTYGAYDSIRVDRRDAPIIVRAALMFHNAPSEDYGEERDQVLDYELVLTTGSTTVADVVEHYQTEKFYESLSSVHREDASGSAQMAETLAELRNTLGSLATQEDIDRLAEQQAGLAGVMQQSAELQKPMAELAKKQMAKMKSDRENALRRDERARAAKFEENVRARNEKSWLTRNLD